MENTKAEVREKIKEAQKVLIGIRKEWALRDDEKISVSVILNRSGPV